MRVRSESPASLSSSPAAPNARTAPRGPAKFLTARDVSERWNISRPTLWRLSKKGYAPRPLRFASGTVRWPLEEIEAFERRLAAERPGNGLHLVSSREV